MSRLAWFVQGITRSGEEVARERVGGDEVDEVNRRLDCVEPYNLL